MKLGRMIQIAKNTTKRHLRRILFVDPGLGGTGWAYFDIINIDGDVGLSPDKFGVLRSAGKGDWISRAHRLSFKFEEVCSQMDPKLVVIENAKVWSRSLKSVTSSERGDLLKLAYLIGSFGQITYEYTDKSPLLIYPEEWKGQLPKDVVIKRCLAYWPSLKKLRDHEADAVGMGLAAQGKL